MRFACTRGPVKQNSMRWLETWQLRTCRSQNRVSIVSDICRVICVHTNQSIGIVLGKSGEALISYVSGRSASPALPQMYKHQTTSRTCWCHSLVGDERYRCLQ